MSISLFIVGAVIFATYMSFTIWNIKTSVKKPRQDWPTYGGEGCDPPPPVDVKNEKK